MDLTRLQELARRYPGNYNERYLSMLETGGMQKRLQSTPNPGVQDDYHATMTEKHKMMEKRVSKPQFDSEIFGPGIFSSITKTPFLADVATQTFTQFGKVERTTPGKVSIVRYARPDANPSPPTVIVYLHGGGLKVGYADSEELSCRRLATKLQVFSIEYRLMPKYTASNALEDALEGFEAIRNWFRETTRATPRILLVGSSSGGELAALVSQEVDKAKLAGVILRCPVMADVISGKDEYLPKDLHEFHHSSDSAFTERMVAKLGDKTAPGFAGKDLMGYIDRRSNPRDGLARMPIEAGEEHLLSMPRTWIQVCLNDVLYSDGVCYAMQLVKAGGQVDVHVVEGWPHTFWLNEPQLEEAEEADRQMMRGLEWVLGP